MSLRLQLQDVFQDSISREELLDPVINQCGHTFSRVQIDGWIASQMNQDLQTTCPDCRGPIDPIIGLAPNFLARHVLEVLNNPQNVEAANNERVVAQRLQTNMMQSGASVGDVELMLQCHRLSLRLFENRSNFETDYRYCKIYKSLEPSRITHSNGTQMSLPGLLKGTFPPCKIALKVDDFPEAWQVAYHGTSTAENLQGLCDSNWRLRESAGRGVFLSPSYAISTYNYAATVFFENSLFQITTQCRARDVRLEPSTLGANEDDRGWADFSLPNLDRPTWSSYFDGAAPEMIASSDNVRVYALIITKIANSVIFRAPSDRNYHLYNDMLWEVRNPAGRIKLL